MNDTMTLFASIVFFVLILNTLTSTGLDFINRIYVFHKSKALPFALRSFMDEKAYEKSIQYTYAKNSFSMTSTLYSAFILGAILFSGFLPKVYFTLIDTVFGTTLWSQAITLWVIGTLLSIPHLPFELWAQFKLEAEFGFNKSTFKLWVLDKIKGLILSFALGVPLISLLLWFVYKMPNYWWFIGFIAIFSFQLLMMIIYPKWILPLFNKLSPLPEGLLKDRLMALAKKTGFHAETIEVIDGSKRSTHSNAYFSGFGKFRRIVLFDTLIDQLSIEELEAVLAHEIGHYKKGHVIKMLAITAVLLLGGFGLLDFLSHWETFYASFGFENAPDNLRMSIAFLLFSLLMPLFTFWCSPLLSAFSRKNEYEADAFAANAIGNSGFMIAALRKLHEKNLSNLTPHPLYSAFHYSHPTLLEREEALRKEELSPNFY